MEPAHGRALTRMPEALELVVPRPAEELVDLELQRRLAECRFDGGGLEPVLRNHDVAVHSGDRVKDSELWCVGEASAFGAGGRLLRDLEPELLPASERRG